MPPPPDKAPDGGLLRGIDPARSTCVLIGVDAYTALEPLGAVGNNLSELARALTDEAIWGVAQDRVRVLANPATQAEVIGAVRAMANLAEDTLIVYYAGHGLLDPRDGHLHLTLPDARFWHPETMLPYQWVRQAMGEGTARRRVVILDCCYSGKALEGMSVAGVGEHVLTNAMEEHGSYVMTSTARDRRALAPKGERLTAFTGEFVDVLRGGVPDGPEILTLNEIFKQVRDRLVRKGRPRPQRQDHNGVGDLPFVRNLAVVPPGPAPESTGTARVSRLLLTTAILVSLAAGTGAGLAYPVVASRLWPPPPVEPGGPCSSRAVLLSHSDALDKTEVMGERIGGLSALALTGSSRAYALADNTPGRIFPISLGPAERLSPRAGTARTLRHADGEAYTTGFDGEGLVVEQGGRTILVSSETGPAIRRFRLDTGRQVGELPIPARFKVWPDGEAQAGRTIEALAATPDGRHLYAALESPLSSDGDGRGRNLLRIQRYTGTPGGKYTPDRQYAYQTGEGLHLTEFVAIGDDRLLTLERQFVRGLGNAVRVYDVPLAGAPDVTGLSSLYAAAADVFVRSELLFDLAACPPGSPGQVARKGPQINPLLDNVEGMALGAPLPGAPGWRDLFLVSDDNQNEQQATRLYAVRVRVP
ncbi:esterase-like activity of phytase family protein [Sphaerisporangium sp. B11E5]|uniref:caspase, EACC1-associated type n=1 Tax=Sphaerisporangium sp. B11E5 TaxID=3153563 RepID=UPI00325F56EE